MRLLSALFLIALIAAFTILAIENNRDTQVNAFKWSTAVPLPLLLAAVYVLGMLTGWWLVGMLKRSWRRATEADRARA